MTTPSFLEDHISQIPALQLLINMGYEYVTPHQAMKWRKGKNSVVIFEEVLFTQLQKINSFTRKGKEYEFSEANINSAILAVKELPVHEGIMTANAAFYDLITLGKAFEQTVDGDKKSHSLQYIDWQNPENNAFHVTEEFSVVRDGRTDTYRPDLVLFVNGIPMCIVECKSPSLTGTKTPVELAIEQHTRNFSKNGIRSLYVYSGLVLSLATNDASYATTGTSKEFWSKWKELFSSKTAEANYWNTLNRLKNTPLTEENKNKLFSDRFRYVRQYFDRIDEQSIDEPRKCTKQDELLYSLCTPVRMLDLIRNFTVYDDGVKKIARYQQYFVVNETIKRVSRFNNAGKRTGGVIWHTQGSGKSLTMVMLAQLLASNKHILNPKILLVTDRIDLDDQLSDTFKKCQKEVRQAKTGTHLSGLISENDDAIITTIINKFEAAVKQCKEPFASPDIFILIDEGHRTQYGSFSVSMQRVFPNACFIAFTGTPLMKKEKNTARKFGGYIGKPYTVTDAIEDSAVVPLLYEGRHNLMSINEKPLNTFFDKVSEPLSDYGKAALKRKFNTINELNKADQIIYARAWDISEHYTGFFQSSDTAYKPKGQLVAPSIKTALLYKHYLDEIGKISSEVVVTRSDQREGMEDSYYDDNEEKQREDTYFKAMEDKYGDLKTFEKSIINQFKKRDHPEILIVVAKLLTGFDAPNNTVLYLCRSLKEHTLLQAIARVNRVYPGKDYGYIIDYYGNLENLDNALDTYSGLEGFDKEDLAGTLTSIDDEIKKLPQAHAEIWDIFKSLKGKNLEATAYEELLSAEDIRNKFYDKLSVFARMLKLALSSVHFVNSTEEVKIKNYKQDAKFFLKLRVDVKRRYNDDISYREYEPQVQKLINKHLSTDGEILKITDLVDIFNKEEREAEVEKIIGKAAQADHIASRTIKAINVKMQDDPIFYTRFADLIKQTIEAYHQKRISEAEYLKRAQKFEDDFLKGRREDAPEQLEKNEVALAFYNYSKSVYNNLELLKTPFHIEMGLAIDRVVKNNIYLNNKKIVDFHRNVDIRGKINIELSDVIYDLLQKYDIGPNWDEIDHLIEECMKIAIHKYK
ncbi:type I restriction endonuclease subunit R [Saccharicrinis sp. FJH2]|uniref:type I restriction endonuclease subunit R n=1 Tax=Saccharicrinis sp. FJH65 TaxID=3344659 RepID=UPI0035F3E57A